MRELHGADLCIDLGAGRQDCQALGTASRDLQHQQQVFTFMRTSEQTSELHAVACPVNGLHAVNISKDLCVLPNC